MTSNSVFSGVVVVLTALSLTSAGIANAQQRAPTAEDFDAARALYKEGKALRAKGDLAAAFEKLQAAHRLGNTPVTGIELARTCVLLGRLVQALDLAVSLASMPVAPDETTKSAEARLEAQKLSVELRSRIPTFVVTLRGLADGEVAHVAIDGIDAVDEVMSLPQRVDPGWHEITARAGHGPSARQVKESARLDEREARELVLELPSSHVAPSTTEGGHTAPLREPTRRTGPTPAAVILTRSGFVVAVVGGAAGALLGIGALNKKSQLDGECPARLCPATASRDLTNARAWATGSTVSFGVAAAGAVAGLVGLLLRNDSRAADGQVGRTWMLGGLEGGAVGVYARF